MKATECCSLFRTLGLFWYQSNCLLVVVTRKFDKFLVPFHDSTETWNSQLQKKLNSFTSVFRVFFWTNASRVKNHRQGFCWRKQVFTTFLFDFAHLWFLPVCQSFQKNFHVLQMTDELVVTCKIVKNRKGAFHENTQLNRVHKNEQIFWWI